MNINYLNSADLSLSKIATYTKKFSMPNKHFDYQDNLITEGIKKGFTISGKAQKIHGAIVDTYMLTRVIFGASPYEYMLTLTSESLPTFKYVSVRRGRGFQTRFFIIGTRKVSEYKNHILYKALNTNPGPLSERILASMINLRFEDNEYLTVFTLEQGNQIENMTFKRYKNKLKSQARHLRKNRRRIEFRSLIVSLFDVPEEVVRSVAYSEMSDKLLVSGTGDTCQLSNPEFVRDLMKIGGGTESGQRMFPSHALKDRLLELHNQMTSKRGVKLNELKLSLENKYVTTYIDKHLRLPDMNEGAETYNELVDYFNFISWVKYREITRIKKVEVLELKKLYKSRRVRKKINYDFTGFRNRKYYSDRIKNFKRIRPLNERINALFRRFTYFTKIRKLNVLTTEKGNKEVYSKIRREVVKFIGGTNKGPNLKKTPEVLSLRLDFSSVYNIDLLGTFKAQSISDQRLIPLFGEDAKKKKLTFYESLVKKELRLSKKINLLYSQVFSGSMRMSDFFRQLSKYKHYLKVGVNGGNDWALSQLFYSTGRTRSEVRFSNRRYKKSRYFFSQRYYTAFSRINVRDLPGLSILPIISEGASRYKQEEFKFLELLKLWALKQGAKITGAKNYWLTELQQHHYIKAALYVLRKRLYLNSRKQFPALVEHQIIKNISKQFTDKKKINQTKEHVLNGVKPLLDLYNEPDKGFSKFIKLRKIALNEYRCTTPLKEKGISTKLEILNAKEPFIHLINQTIKKHKRLLQKKKQENRVTKVGILRARQITNLKQLLSYKKMFKTTEQKKLLR